RLRCCGGGKFFLKKVFLRFQKCCLLSVDATCRQLQCSLLLEMYHYSLHVSDDNLCAALLMMQEFSNISVNVYCVKALAWEDFERHKDIQQLGYASRNFFQLSGYILSNTWLMLKNVK
ncbi:unnamed protein product, partial [Gulo gulo]